MNNKESRERQAKREESREKREEMRGTRGDERREKRDEREEKREDFSFCLIVFGNLWLVVQQTACRSNRCDVCIFLGENTGCVLVL